jgi:hypothetical protein
MFPKVHQYDLQCTVHVTEIHLFCCWPGGHVSLGEGEKTCSIHCTGGWVGPRAGLDIEARGKILCPRRGSNPHRPVVQPVVRHYTA